MIPFHWWAQQKTWKQKVFVLCPSPKIPCLFHRQLLWKCCFERESRAKRAPGNHHPQESIKKRKQQRCEKGTRVCSVGCCCCWSNWSILPRAAAASSSSSTLLLWTLTLESRYPAHGDNPCSLNVRGKQMRAVVVPPFEFRTRSFVFVVVVASSFAAVFCCAP